MSSAASLWRDRIVPITLLVPSISLALTAGTQALAIGFVVLGVLAVALGGTLRAGRATQALTTLAALVAGLLASRLLAPDSERMGELSERALLLGAPALLVGLARSVLRDPLYGARFTLMAGLVAMTAAGRAQTGWLFPSMALAYTALGAVALRAHDPDRAPLRVLSFRHLFVIGFAAMLALSFMGGLGAGLPRLHDRFVRGWMSRMQNRTGLTDTMYLGSLDGLLESERAVLRVRGSAPPLLRGLIYSRYQGGRWEAGRDLSQREVLEVSKAPPSEGSSTELEFAIEPKWYFVPKEAVVIGTSTGYVDRDPLGLYGPSDGAVAKRVWIEPGSADERPPTDEDLAVSGEVAGALGGIVRAWGAHVGTDRERLAKIASRLGSEEFAYSREFERSARHDPVIEFLRDSKRGHCEYFASAFTLLARSTGLPARMVAGYRVTERSPYGYAIVREKNAHSWAEVYLDGHWETFDPTPSSELPQTLEPSFLSALGDRVRTEWERVDDWLRERSAFEFSVVLVLLIGALITVRILRQERRATAALTAEEGPPPEMERLLASLARLGFAADGSETWSALVRRAMPSLPAPMGQELARLVGVYERARYGEERLLPATLREAEALGRGLANLQRKRPRSLPELGAPPSR